MSVDVKQWSKAVDLREEDGSAWKEKVLRTICIDEIVEAILKIPWPNRSEKTNCFGVIAVWRDFRLMIALL